MGDQYGLVNVRAFGATGNGSSDDTRALRAALSAVGTGGTVYLPPGVYVVAPTAPNGVILPIPGPNVRVTGAGIGQAVIKVKSGSLPYAAILSGADGASLGNLEVDHLTFDGNISNNPIVNNAEMMDGGFRCSLLSFLGAGQNVHHVEVKNSSAVNDIVLGGDGASITHCRFTACGDDPNHVVFDSSSVYVHSYGAVVADNYWKSAGVNSPSARAAIEMHGKDYTISGNVIRDYAVGMNVTGVSLVDGKSVAVFGNTISGAGWGIQLWSVKYSTHTAGYGLDGALIVNNSIQLEQTGAWSLMAPLGGSIGIGLVQGSDLDARVRIAHNYIVSPVEQALIAANQGSFGIGWNSNTGAILRDSDISENAIIGFPLSGIRLCCGIENVNVRNNNLRDCGSTLDTSIPVAARTPIYIAGTTIDGLRIEGNTVSDTHAVTRNVYGAFLTSSGVRRFATVAGNEARIFGAGAGYLGDGFTWQ